MLMGTSACGRVQFSLVDAALAPFFLRLPALEHYRGFKLPQARPTAQALRLCCIALPDASLQPPDLLKRIRSTFFFGMRNTTRDAPVYCCSASIFTEFAADSLHGCPTPVLSTAWPGAGLCEAAGVVGGCCQAPLRSGHLCVPQARHDVSGVLGVHSTPTPHPVPNTCVCLHAHTNT